MKTTLDMPDALYRKVKVYAAARGLTVRQVVTQALSGHIASSSRIPAGEPAWMKVFGKAPRGAAEEINRIIEAGCERIHPADWK